VKNHTAEAGSFFAAADNRLGAYLYNVGKSNSCQLYSTVHDFSQTELKAHPNESR